MQSIHPSLLAWCQRWYYPHTTNGRGLAGEQYGLGTAFLRRKRVFSSISFSHTIPTDGDDDATLGTLPLDTERGAKTHRSGHTPSLPFGTVVYCMYYLCVVSSFRHKPPRIYYCKRASRLLLVLRAVAASSTPALEVESYFCHTRVERHTAVVQAHSLLVKVLVATYMVLPMIPLASSLSACHVGISRSSVRSFCTKKFPLSMFVCVFHPNCPQRSTAGGTVDRPPAARNGALGRNLPLS